MSKILSVMTIVTVIVLCGLLTWVGSEALAAVPKRCSDSRGSVLAMHSRTLCNSVTRKARREHPRWSHVGVSCAYVTHSRSACDWSYDFPGGSCRGKADVSGVAHRRVVYRDESCVA